jgi:hypothetical protein
MLTRWLLYLYAHRLYCTKYHKISVNGYVRDQPETLEISMDTKAKVALGDYVRGGKNPDGRRR